MLILPKQTFSTPFCNKITFQARKEKSEQINFSLNLDCNISDVAENTKSLLGGSEQGQKIRAQLNDPKQKDVFCSTFVSLLATAASQLTEIITNEPAKTYVPKTRNVKTDDTPTRKISPDGDVFEASVIQTTKPKEEVKKDIELIVLQNHKGRLRCFERELMSIIDLTTQKLELNNEEINSLNNLYNEFCGKNYKGYHLTNNDKKVSNEEIAESLATRLQDCENKKSLKGIVKEFSAYTLTQAPELIEKEEKVKSSGISNKELNPEILKIIKPYKNILASYKNFLKEDNSKQVKESNDYKRRQVDEFLRKINDDEELKDVKLPLFKSMNEKYSSYLYNIAFIVNRNNDKNTKQQILDKIIDKTIVPEALTKWEEYKFNSDIFSFNDFNSLIGSNVKDENIQKLLKLKKDGYLISINIINPENYVIRLPYKSTENNFNTINEVHQILNGENFGQLENKNEKTFQFKDIVAEINANKSSYPNLYRYLHVEKTKDLLDQKSMKHLTNLYRHESSRNLFTPHAYLRFMERVVLPEFIDDDGFFKADYITKEELGNKYKEKLGKLKSAIKELGSVQLEIGSYNGDGKISAPKFSVCLGNSPEDKDYFITINNKGRIHTIF